MPLLRNKILELLIKTKEGSVFRKVYLFLTSEHSADALRNTFAAITPGIVLFYLGYPDEAITVGTGALLSSLTDSAGNRQDKWKSALWCIPLFFIAALVTSLLLGQAYILIIWLIFAAFVLTMLGVYGPRMGAVGLMTLILVTFTIGLWPADALTYSIQISLGVCWYFLISIVQIYIQPYRSLRYAMADGFHSTAMLLKAKARFYDEHVPLMEAYRELGVLHVKVSEQQEAVRFLLLRENRLTDDRSGKGRYWINHMVGLTDLYELLTALDHDYDVIRKTLAPLGVLEQIRQLILLLAEEVDSLSWRFTDNKRVLEIDSRKDVMADVIQHLMQVRDHVTGEEAQILDATIRNVAHILDCTDRIRRSFNNEEPLSQWNERYDYASFVVLPPNGWKTLRRQLNFRTTVFPFALRVAILFGIGGLFGVFLPEYRYAYWILLTLAIVTKPSFVYTKRRNLQRIWGTFSGVALGLLLVYLIPSIGVLLLLAAIFLYGFFLFNRVNYGWSVFSLTPGIVIALHVYEGNINDILGSRIAFTLMGSALALIGWFFVPVRQGKGLGLLAGNVLDRHADYLQMVKDRWQGVQVESNDLRLARKQAHQALAVFSESIQQLQGEPGGKKWKWENIHAFHSMIYRVNALIIGLSVGLSADGIGETDFEEFAARVNHINRLMDDLRYLSADFARSSSKG